jgi:endonuclease/exonuclease/phosphatase (EEP) superfamily protein YafD
MGAMRMRRFAASRGADALAWTAVAIWAIWALIRVLGLDHGSFLVAVIAFTPWMALVSPVPVLVAALLKRWLACVAAVAVMAVFAITLLPRSFGDPTAPAGAPGPTLAVMAVNVEYGRADADAVVSLVDRLGVEALAVAELTNGYVRELERAGLADRLPHSVLAAAPRARGTGLYAAAPLARRSAAPLPGGFELPRATLAGRGVELVAVHSAPPTSGADVWRTDLETLPSALERPMRILLGDFNATLDHDAFRDLLEHGYADAAETLGEGLTMTWPADRRLPPLVAIDHVLADERIGIREFSAHDVPGTDHRAVFAELALPARADG